MSMNSPLMPGAYSRRAEDCLHAVERDFFRIVGSAATAYIDVDRILGLLAEDATRAGWTEEEVTTAVHELARRHGMNKAGVAHS